MKNYIPNNRLVYLFIYLLIYFFSTMFNRLKLESKIKLESIISGIKALKQKH